MDSDKKIKLEELPDEGSDILPPPQKKITKFKKIIDPRVARLKTLSHDEKISEMKQRWFFDRPIWCFGWVAYLLLVLSLYISDIGQIAAEQTKVGHEENMGLGQAFMPFATLSVEKLLSHPWVFALLTPLLFSFRKRSPFFMEITFDGIHTVRSIEFKEAEPARVFIKWKEIVAAQKRFSVKNKEILELYSPEGKTAELAWNLRPKQKYAVLVILREIVHEKHPLLVFLEKELH